MTKIVLAYDKKEDIRFLFTEYTAMLVANDPIFAKSLTMQHYDEEIEHLQAKYGGPDGRLYSAYVEGQPAGCVGFHRFDGTRSELKRLYVQPCFRGHHVATLLMDQVLQDMTRIGYKKCLLDTLPFLQEAIQLYKKYGFYEIPAYYDTPVQTTIFMEKALDLGTVR